MFAVIETGGKQYRVQQGSIIFVEKLAAEVGDVVQFSDVLAVGQGSEVAFGTPLLTNVHVAAKVTEQGKEKKIIIFRYKAKSRYRKKNGHRQPFTKVIIESITVN
ncbi:MAG: 50S ribosomal protein L21 [Peptococcaceae bacterium]|nr:50S ribosomal protein L21 [Peptococcaceae bacterium]MBT9137116.1 50S ribosomal protein L21 [Bacillota bacterium]MBT9152543.1 50S ribosomal protein L21 [Bacillota bacterium]MBT9158332.1 50S ribosomal protein L21 [Bacillota bacterium]